MAVKFDEELNRRLLKVAKNFNQKVKYNKTKTRGRGMLPDILDVKEFKARYSDKSKAEIEKQLKLYENFSKHNALDMAIPTSRLSRWERDYFLANMEKTKKFYDTEIADLRRITDTKDEFYLKFNPRLQDLIVKRELLDEDFNTLSEGDIKSLRRVFSYAERSEYVKNRAIRHYFNQLERVMTLLGYSKREIDSVLDKFTVLSENEFIEMERQEDLIDIIYRIIDSPKGRGQYQIMAEELYARNAVEDIIENADAMIAKYKKSSK